MNNLHYISSKEMFTDIVSKLSIDPYFQNFKFRKKDSVFMKNDKKLGISKRISLDHWGDPICKCLTIRPAYRIRFDILHKWFEMFSFRPLKVQREDRSVGFSTSMIFDEEIDGFRYGDTDTYLFLLYDNSAGFEERFEIFKRDIKYCSEYVFENFGNLKKMYFHCIIPILEGGLETMSDIGVSDLFIYLTLCKIVNPSVYGEFKELALKRTREMIDKGEPNYVEYESKLDDIFNCLESIDFSDVDINATC